MTKSVNSYNRPMTFSLTKRVHFVLGAWVASHVGHAVLSIFYEKETARIFVPAIYTAFVLLAIGAWGRNRWAAKMSAIAALMTIIIQGLFVWKREAYGSLSLPVLAFDILGIACSLLYLVFYFSSNRERYLTESTAG